MEWRLRVSFHVAKPYREEVLQLQIVKHFCNPSPACYCLAFVYCTGYYLAGCRFGCCIVYCLLQVLAMARKNKKGICCKNWQPCTFKAAVKCGNTAIRWFGRLGFLYE